MTARGRFCFDADIVVYAADLDSGDRHERQIPSWDAIMWAMARRFGCPAVVSEDMQDGRRLGGVEFINPFADRTSARLATLPRA